jgi:hypothetical protein
MAAWCDHVAERGGVQYGGQSLQQRSLNRPRKVAEQHSALG